MQDSLKNSVPGLIAPLLSEREIELVDLTISRTKTKLILRFFVEKDGGIKLNECAKLNKELGEFFDQNNLIEGSYVLEVSSPGIDRPLVSTRDFQRVIGKSIKCVLHEQFEGESVYRGLVSAIDDECVTITIEKKGDVSVPRNSIARANVEVKL